MAAAKLLIDRVIPSRRGAPVSFHVRPLKTPEDCALAYADLLDDVGSGPLTSEEALSPIVGKCAELFPSLELAAEDAARRGHGRSDRFGANPPPAAGDRLSGGPRSAQLPGQGRPASEKRDDDQTSSRTDTQVPESRRRISRLKALS